MLKAVIVDASALSRDLLNTVLSEGGYGVAGQTHTSSQGYALALKFRPQLICIAREQMDDGEQIVEQIRANLPKTIIFMLSGALDAPTLQAALARGVQGFIVKPFKADAVLKTIRSTVLAMIRKQQG
ncbi:response regulator [Massilia sp. TWR1-2-2]|uniref:response regulator n=1 Tax=Massilia sp. TWR1-2-2 TaxID=2804584 RepID=UPI003CEE2CAA